MKVLVWDFNKCVMCGQCIVTCQKINIKAKCHFTIDLNDKSKMYRWECLANNLMSKEDSAYDNCNMYSSESQCQEFACVDSCSMDALFINKK